MNPVSKLTNLMPILSATPPAAARSTLVLIAALLGAACTPSEAPAPQGQSQSPAENVVAEAPAPAPDPDAVTADGWGPLRIGMTRDEVVAALGEDANPDAVGGAEPEYCDQFRPAAAPEGMLVMVELAQLTRITLMSGSELRTDEGFGIGDSAEAIKAAYAERATSTPHKYLPTPAEYITFWRVRPSERRPRGIVYEVGTDGLVSHIHAGGPSIQYVEGCS